LRGTTAGYVPTVSTPDPTTAPSDSGPQGREDVQSDPAKGAEERADWSDEGGATAEGPADD
jgi:hypothetical protein